MIPRREEIGVLSLKFTYEVLQQAPTGSAGGPGCPVQHSPSFEKFSNGGQERDYTPV